MSYFDIKVKLQSSVTPIVQVQPSDTIRYVKTKVEEMWGIPVDLQCLVFADKELEDLCLLGDCGIRGTAILELVIRRKLMQIYIATFGRRFGLDVDPSYTVENVKAMIQVCARRFFIIRRIECIRCELLRPVITGVCQSICHANSLCKHGR